MMGAQDLPMGFLRVGEHTARNPVARAVARARIKQAALEFKIRLHMLPANTYAAADGLAAADMLMVAYDVLEQRGQASSPAARIIHGGMSCLVQLAERGFRWRTADAPAVDVALTHAEEVFQTSTAKETEAAWLKCARTPR